MHETHIGMILHYHRNTLLAHRALHTICVNGDNNYEQLILFQLNYENFKI